MSSFKEELRRIPADCGENEAEYKFLEDIFRAA